MYQALYISYTGYIGRWTQCDLDVLGLGHIVLGIYQLLDMFCSEYTRHWTYQYCNRLCIYCALNILGLGKLFFECMRPLTYCTLDTLVIGYIVTQILQALDIKCTEYILSTICVRPCMPGTYCAGDILAVGHQPESFFTFC